MKFTSSVLVIGHPDGQKLTFGADLSQNYEDAIQKLQHSKYQAIAINTDLKGSSDLLKLTQSLKTAGAETQVILVGSQATVDILMKITNQVRIFKMLKSFQMEEFEHTIQEALEEYALLQQNVDLIDLVNRQNEQLKSLSVELESRVKKRQQLLETTRERLLETNKKSEALHRALLTAQKAQSIAEMEELITQAISLSLKISFIKIELTPVGSLFSTMKSKTPFHFYQTDIFKDHSKSASVFYARQHEEKKVKAFNAHEKEFLDQITEAIGLALDRLQTLSESEDLKQQWEATFDAISSPLALVDQNYRVQAGNLAYAKKAGIAIEKIAGQICYQVLFKKDSPCKNCKLGTHFPLKQDASSYQVKSHSLEKTEQSTLYVNLYRDISEKEKVEKQILESAKMAELGTIGSSIAHELNNPLAGMLTFLQLMKMDLKGTEPYAHDIQEMELGAQRCKEIIHHLLSFTRVSQDGESNKDLKKIAERSLRILELQSKSFGIETQLICKDSELPLNFDANLLTQVLTQLLQIILDQLKKQKAGDADFLGFIHLNLIKEKKKYLLNIESNAQEISSKILGPLGPSASLNILSSYGGKLEIFAESPAKSTVQILLPGLDFSN